jgi:Tfp pilus assembly protein PilN
MIQLNLLPDVKLKFIKTKRTKRLVMLSSFAVIAFSIALFVVMYSAVNVVQKRHLANLNKDISKYRMQLEETKDVTKILTVQNQLNNIDALHEQKPVASRLPDYIAQLVPAKAGVSQITVDFTQNTVNMSGTADSLATVNKFVDTLKFTDYKAVMKADDGTVVETKEGKAFSGVVLSGFSKDDEQATFQVSFTFDPIIFSSDYEVTLSVPNIISTRSNVEKPEALFQDVTPNNGGAQ